MGSSQRLLGSEIVVKCLEEQGTKHVFSFPGGVVIPLFDAFYRMDHDIQQIEPCHEQNGVHAADGYARVTGRASVAITTSGPGATNAVTGIANAYLDSVPLVVITGQVAQALLGKDSFQEIDITSVTMQITKHNFQVNDVTMLATTLREAFRIAESGRPGPVVVDIPKDIFMTEADYTPIDVETLKHNAPRRPGPQRDAVMRAAEFINAAKRPIIYAGGGVIKSNASEELISFAKKSGIPVANSLMGLGSFPRTDPLSLGLVGMHGSHECNLAVINCDTLIAIGARFSDRVTGNINEFMRDKKIIHIDIDPTEFEKNVPTNVHIQADVKEVLKIMLPLVEEKTYPDWYAQIDQWPVKGRDCDEYCPKNIIERLNKAYEDAYVVTEVGQHQMWAGQYWKFKYPTQFNTSGGLGTMGYGLGASIGIQLAKPDSDVVLIAGDGSFRMNCQELITVSRYKLPIKIFLFDNQTLGMVRQWQKLFHGKRYAQTDLDQGTTDYCKLAEASGIQSFTVENLDDLDEVLEEIKDKNEPVFVRCLISKEEGVYPMVAAGNPIDELYYE
ncbi:MAG: biosynthetic-type acetolactate synthase large subunit [Eubacteriaceae bacterium]|jgi:acetolactate synthase-1/2/3 large subunit|nr:biosynthetic-type acetolactate synthase large subunit [Eubacteriaceae bacterium]